MLQTLQNSWRAWGCTWLTSVVAVFWFVPIYVGAGWAFVWCLIQADHQVGLYLIGDIFQTMALYALTLFYFAALSYAAMTDRIWIPNAFIRIGLQYLFRAPHPHLKTLAAYLFAAVPSFVYFFPLTIKLVEPFTTQLPTPTADLQPMAASALAFALGYIPGLAVTRLLLKNTHFIRLHCLGILEHHK